MKDRNENRPGYKKTKVGWIPLDWELKRLGDLGQINTGTTPRRVRTDYFAESSVPWVKTMDLNNCIVSSTDECITDKAIEETGCRVHPRGTLLVAMYGGFRQIGRTGILGVPAATNQAISALPPTPELFNSLFVQCFLNYFVGLWRRYAASSRKDPNITRDDVKSFYISFPPLSEQKKIAEILSTWDGAIEQTRKLIDAKKRRKKALMQQLLTGKKRLPGFKEKWKTYRLNELIKQISRRVEFDDHAIYDLISVRRRSGGVFNRGKMPGHTIRTKQMYLAKRGDFLISKMQIVHGASALATKEFDSKHISGSYIALRVRDSQKLDVYFLNWLSKTPHFYHLTYLSSYGVHIEKMTFNLRLFLKSKISIPEDIKEQRCIVEALSTADGEIEQLEVKLKALEKQKRGLMQKLLTGEVRVSV